MLGTSRRRARAPAKRHRTWSAVTEVSTDLLASYARPLRAARVGAHNRYNSKKAGPDELGMADVLHQRLKSFLARFNDVSTRKLQPYLSWFTWGLDARRVDSALALLAEEAGPLVPPPPGA